jgi:hypothetical protein
MIRSRKSVTSVPIIAETKCHSIGHPRENPIARGDESGGSGKDKPMFRQPNGGLRHVEECCSRIHAHEMVPVGRSSEAGIIRAQKRTRQKPGLRLVVVHKSRIARGSKVATAPLVAANADSSSI